MIGGRSTGPELAVYGNLEGSSIGCSQSQLSDGRALRSLTDSVHIDNRVRVSISGDLSVIRFYLPRLASIASKFCPPILTVLQRDQISSVRLVGLTMQLALFDSTLFVPHAFNAPPSHPHIRRLTDALATVDHIPYSYVLARCAEPSIVAVHVSCQMTERRFVSLPWIYAGAAFICRYASLPNDAAL